MEILRLALLGASGHGKVVVDTALMVGCEEVIFFDDAWPDKTTVGPWSVIGNSKKLIEYKDSFDGAIVSIGNNLRRLAAQSFILENKIQLIKIIHPSAIVSLYSEIGMGSVVFAGSVVNAFAKIGSGCIINTCSSIDHVCVLADGVHLSPGAHLGGGVSVGTATWIGIGASVKQGVHIGENVIVGAGAAVVNDIESGLTVVGVPARRLNIK